MSDDEQIPTPTPEQAEAFREFARLADFPVPVHLPRHLCFLICDLVRNAEDGETWQPDEYESEEHLRKQLAELRGVILEAERRWDEASGATDAFRRSFPARD